MNRFYDTQVYRTLANEFFHAVKTVRSGGVAPISYHRSHLGRPTEVWPGRYGAVDIGGSHLRVAAATVLPEGRVIIEDLVKHPLPTAESVEVFFSRVAHALGECLSAYPEVGNLGLTFSYPMQMHSPAGGIVLQWTKALHLETTVPVDPAQALAAAMHRAGRPIHVAALLNDTIAAAIAGGVTADMGLVVGTGFNLCVYDPDLGEFINLEAGQFNSEALSALTTSWDQQVDRESANPGHQLTEKQVGGLYLGRVATAILAHRVTAQDMARLDDDTRPPTPEREVCRALRYRAVGIVSACIEGAAGAFGKSSVRVSVDGSLFALYNAFRLQLQRHAYVIWTEASHASIVGAVLAAATQIPQGKKM